MTTNIPALIADLEAKIPRWVLAEGNPPLPVGDCRKIVWIREPSGMEYWGVRAYNHAIETSGWYTNGRLMEPESGVVLYWMDGPCNPFYPNTCPATDFPLLIEAYRELKLRREEGIAMIQQLQGELLAEVEKCARLEDRLRGATVHLEQAIGLVDRITDRENTDYADYSDRARSATRKYTLKDARQNAKSASMELREAWEILDPCTKAALQSSPEGGSDGHV